MWEDGATSTKSTVCTRRGTTSTILCTAYDESPPNKRRDVGWNNRRILQSNFCIVLLCLELQFNVQAQDLRIFKILRLLLKPGVRERLLERNTLDKDGVLYKRCKKRLLKGKSACNVKCKGTQSRLAGVSRDLQKMLWESPTVVCAIPPFVPKNIGHFALQPPKPAIQYNTTGMGLCDTEHACNTMHAYDPMACKCFGVIIVW